MRVSSPRSRKLRMGMLEEWLEAPMLAGTRMRVFGRPLTLEELDEVHELNCLDADIELAISVR